MESIAGIFGVSDAGSDEAIIVDGVCWFREKQTGPQQVKFRRPGWKMIQGAVFK